MRTTTDYFFISFFFISLFIENAWNVEIESNSQSVSLLGKRNLRTGCVCVRVRVVY